MENLCSATDTSRIVECSGPKRKMGAGLLVSHILFWAPYKANSFGDHMVNRPNRTPNVQRGLVCTLPLWGRRTHDIKQHVFPIKKDNKPILPRPLEFQKWYIIYFIVSLIHMSFQSKQRTCYFLFSRVHQHNVISAGSNDVLYNDDLVTILTDEIVVESESIYFWGKMVNVYCWLCQVKAGYFWCSPFIEINTCPSSKRSSSIYKFAPVIKLCVNEHLQWKLPPCYIYNLLLLYRIKLFLFLIYKLKNSSECNKKR